MNQVTDTTDPGGRAAIRLRHGDDTVLIALLGAQVLSWHHRGRDVLWTATNAEYVAGKPVRGGIPVVFPWFGDHPANPALPPHGFVRNQNWRPVTRGPGATVTLECESNEATMAMWPHPFRLRLQVALTDTLAVRLEIENTGAAPFRCEEALHTYFVVGDIDRASVHGLEGVAFVEHARSPEPSWDPQAPIGFRAETDRVFQGVPDRIELRAPALASTVVLTTQAVQSAIVWNPWPAKCARLSQMAADDWRRFVCIESANVKERAFAVAPGERHTMALVLSATHDPV